MANEADAGGDRVVVGLPGDDLSDRVVVDGPVDCRGEPLDLGPATRADLEDLDAVPEPVDSAAPAVTYLPGARPIGPDAQTRPYRIKLEPVDCPVSESASGRVLNAVTVYGNEP